jgi:hypothetical protein
MYACAHIMRVFLMHVRSNNARQIFVSKMLKLTIDIAL